MALKRWASDANLTNGPRAGEPTKVTPTDAQIAEGLVAGTGLPSTFVNWWMNEIDRRMSGVYGNAADGNITYSTNTTLSANICADTITINSGVHVTTAGYTVRCRRLVFQDDTASIGWDGNDGNDAPDTTNGGSAGGALSSIGPLGVSGAGGAGGDVTVSGAAGNNSTNAPGAGSAGAGGDGNGPTGGTSGTATAPAAADGDWRQLGAALQNLHMMGEESLTQLDGGAGGGGGGGASGTGAGGGGGSGGGPVLVMAESIEGNGSITARGGNGGDASGGGGGGGGGGQGGFVMVVCRPDADDFTADVSGGTGGTATGAGVDGGDGQDGLAITLYA